MTARWARRYALPLAAWMTLIFALSAQPELPRAPGTWLDFAVKKGLHAAGYGVLAWLWWRALLAAGVRRPALWAFGLTVAYALSDEWHQTFVPGRTGRARDVLIDAAGAAVALAIATSPRRGWRSKGRRLP